MSNSMYSLPVRVLSFCVACVFAVCLVGQPKAKAVAVVDDVAVGAAATAAYLTSTGIPLTVAAGGASAASAGIVAVAGEYAAATGAAASGEAVLSSIAAGTALTAAGTVVLTAAAAVAVGALAYWAYNKYFVDVDSPGNSAVVYSAGNTGTRANLADGTSLKNYNCNFGVLYTLENGSTFLLSKDSEGGLSIILNGAIVKTVKASISSSFSYYGFGLSVGVVRYYYSDGSHYYADNLTTFNNDMWYVPESALSLVDAGYTPIPEIAPVKQLELDIAAPPELELADLPEFAFGQVSSGGWSQPSNVPYSVVDPDPVPAPDPVPDAPPVVDPNPDLSDTPEDVKPFTVGLGDVFPFCIPFDVYHMVTLLVAEPEAPSAEWKFTLPWGGSQEYSVGWDLSAWDDVASLCRSLQCVLFCVGLAVVTYKYIRW